MVLELTDGRLKTSIAKRLLAPLREGNTVLLVVNDPRLPKKKRVEKPLLFLAPMSVYGGPDDQIVVSLQAYGSEVFSTLEKITPAPFYRMGLSIKLASTLARELNLVFRQGDTQHGNR